MIFESGIISLILQFITGIFSFLGINIKVPDDKKLLVDLLKVELGVQAIEFIFYIWLIFNVNKISNITRYRYYDWMISTPLMLITLSAFLDQNNNKSLYDYIKNNKKFLSKILLANLLMLVFGLLGELNIIDYNLAIILGWIPFIYLFKEIYDKYIKTRKDYNTTKEKKRIYYFFLISWSLYGVAAFLPYSPKNTMYNILDLFSKNLLGIFLFYIIWKNRIPT
jgi:bacteriorhodopsin